MFTAPKRFFGRASQALRDTINSNKIEETPKIYLNNNTNPYQPTTSTEGTIKIRNRFFFRLRRNWKNQKSLKEEMPHEFKTKIFCKPTIDTEKDRDFYYKHRYQADALEDPDNLFSDIETNNKFDALVDQAYPITSNDEEKETINFIVNKKMKKTFRNNENYELETEKEKEQLIKINNEHAGYIIEEGNNNTPYIRSQRFKIPETNNTIMQTDEQEIGCDTNDLEHFNTLIKAINSDQMFFNNDNYQKLRTTLLKRAQKCKASSKLTHFLKCKHAFAVRVPQLLVTMRQDARVWLAAKENGSFKLDTEEEFI